MSAYDVVDGARSRQRSTKRWLVGDGEKARCFTALRNVAYGPFQPFRKVAGMVAIGG